MDKKLILEYLITMRGKVMKYYKAISKFDPQHKHGFFKDVCNLDTRLHTLREVHPVTLLPVITPTRYYDTGKYLVKSVRLFNSNIIMF